ncbi:MAG: hypothetical protein DWQ10_00035 [Calditrichaeota bacterium]|nr:MAG: hypothetical protein DWQ10_00035 [Calditrichota bacterium]
MDQSNIYRTQSRLYRKINAAIHRWRRNTALKGIAIVLAIFAVGIGLIALLSSTWTTAPYLIPGIAVVTIILFLMAIFRFIILPFRHDISAEHIAQLLESEHPELEDRLITAMDSSIRRGGVDIYWLKKIVAQASERTNNISFEKAVNRSNPVVWYALLATAFAVLLSVVFFKTQWTPHITQMVHSDFKAPQPLPELYVAPGDHRMMRGAGLRVTATVKNYVPSDIMLYYDNGDSTWQSVIMPPQGSDQADVGYAFFDVQKEFDYYVKAESKISDIFHVSLYDAPQIKQIDLTYNYPSYTKLKTHSEKDVGDVWAPIGTRVTVHALSSVPVIQAELILGDEQSIDMTMKTDTTIQASFVVKGDSFYKIRLETADGLDNSPLAEYFIRALKNQPPAITVLRPNRDIQATMLEEIPVKADISDDFGMQDAVLVVQVNSRDEQEIKLQSTDAKALKNDLTYQTQEFSTLLYLEDLNVKPGDFLSYYFRAEEGKDKATVSDMYYIEISNFDNIYKVATSAGSGGGGGNAPQFAKLQKDIITAANKLLQNKNVMPAEEYTINLESLFKTQVDVRTSIESIVQRAKLRGRMLQQEQNRIVDALADAVAAMKLAEPRIENDSLETAMPHMRIAYHHLIKADVLVRERQISNSRGHGQGGAQNQRELTRLFQDELEKMKSKYETLQQGDNEQVQQDNDEALRRIQELARRQNQLNQANQRLAQQNLAEEEKQREIKKLQRQQEEINKDTQELMQQMAENNAQKQQNAEQSAQSSNELRKASQAMNRATQKLQKAQPQNALANGREALDRLRKLEESLQQMQQDGLRDELQKLQKQMETLAQSQKDLTESTKRSAGSGRLDSTAIAENRERQESIRDKYESTLDELDKISQNRDNEQAEAKRELKQVQRDLARKNLEEHMKQAESLLEKNQVQEAERLMDSIHKSLASANQDLNKAMQGLKKSSDQELQKALNETKALRSKLEDLLAQNNPENRPAGGSGSEKSTEKLQEELWKSRQQFRELSNLLSKNPEMREHFRDLENATNGIVRQTLPGSQRLDLIEAQLVYKMKLIEAELQAQLHIENELEAVQNLETVSIPQEYRDLVEEYFRNLSSTKRK